MVVKKVFWDPKVPEVPNSQQLSATCSLLTSHSSVTRSSIALVVFCGINAEYEFAMGANQGMIWKATFPFHLVLSFCVGFDKREYMK